MCRSIYTGTELGYKTKIVDSITKKKNHFSIIFTTLIDYLGIINKLLIISRTIKTIFPLFCLYYQCAS